jgi:hypothetical protein
MPPFLVPSGNAPNLFGEARRKMNTRYSAAFAVAMFSARDTWITTLKAYALHVAP